MKQNGHDISLYCVESYRWEEYCSVCGAERQKLIDDCPGKYVTSYSEPMKNIENQMQKLIDKVGSKV